MIEDLLPKVRRLELKARKMVNSRFAGEYRTAFKGTGLEFDEVRAYQYGDDVRTIDWNVTARAGEPYIKSFREERELHVSVLVDVSGSLRVGAQASEKLRVAVSIAATFGFCTLPNNDRFSLLAFTDRIEYHGRPGKGRKHILAQLQALLALEPQSQQTNIASVLEQYRKMHRRRSLVVVISDFLDSPLYRHPLVALLPRHEVVLIRLFHPDEILPRIAGIIPVYDVERGTTQYLNTADRMTSDALRYGFTAIDHELATLSNKHGFGYLTINTAQDYFLPLFRFFMR